MADESRAVEYRGKLTQEMVDDGTIVSPRVEAAFRTVPRHAFAPTGTPLDVAYARDRLVTKRDEKGATISSVSAPHIQAMMLEQADLAPGMRCLEIGSGGYNAALMAEVVGDDGDVTTVDIDPDVVGWARRCLAAAGYAQRVRAVQGDAEHGVADFAPYDRIVVTVGAWDIPPAWVEQLTEQGRLVVPLRMRGLTRSVAFQPEGGHLVSLGHQMSGFVAMQGLGEWHERLVPLHDDDIGLRIDETQPLDVDALRAAVLQPRVEVWSGVRFGAMEPWDGLNLWLATSAEDFALLACTRTERAEALVCPSARIGTPALLDGGTFAYHAFREVDAEDTYEFGVYAHGVDGRRLADQMVDQIRVWDQKHRHGPGARITVHPAGTPREQLPPGRVLEKRHSLVTISWP